MGHAPLRPAGVLPAPAGDLAALVLAVAAEPRATTRPPASRSGALCAETVASVLADGRGFAARSIAQTVARGALTDPARAASWAVTWRRWAEDGAVRERWAAERAGCAFDAGAGQVYGQAAALVEAAVRAGRCPR